MRVAPNALSYANFQAWQDIYCVRPGHRAFPKNPLWWGEPPGRAPSLVATPSLKDHARMRDIINNCFSTRAVRGQEASVQFHVDLMVRRFREQIAAAVGKEKGKGSTIVNIVDWYMFYTFDVLGDLMFSLSFECLRTVAYTRGSRRFLTTSSSARTWAF